MASEKAFMPLIVRVMLWGVMHFWFWGLWLSPWYWKTWVIQFCRERKLRESGSLLDCCHWNEGASFAWCHRNSGVGSAAAIKTNRYQATISLNRITNRSQPYRPLVRYRIAIQSPPNLYVQPEVCNTHLARPRSDRTKPDTRTGSLFTRNGALRLRKILHTIILYTVRYLNHESWT